MSFSARLVRSKEWRGAVKWHEQPAVGQGIYIGFRTVYEGTHVPGVGGYDPEPGYLRLSGSLTHALVVTNERHAPVRVPFSALEIQTPASEDR